MSQLATKWIKLILLAILTALPNYVGALSSIPSKIRVDQNGRPRLCGVIEAAIGVGTRVALLAANVEKCKVRIHANSNREILRGNLGRFTLDLHQARGPLLRVQSLHVEGTQMKLGLWPLLLSTAPLVWMMVQPPLGLLLLCFWVSRSNAYQRLVSTQREVRNAKGPPQPWFQRVRNKLGGSPCSLDYSLVLSQSDMSHSRMLQFALRSLLRSLMLNSVLGAAAVAADTMAVLQQDSTRTQKSQLKRISPTSSFLLNSEERSTVNKEGGIPSKEESNPLMLTQLLDATKFELINVTIADQNRLWLDADAVFPDEDKSRLSYTLRVQPIPTRIPVDETATGGSAAKQNALALANPECRFSLGDSLPNQPFWGRWVPDLWISVGAGVAVPLTRHHLINSIETTSESIESTCNVKGRVLLFYPPRSSRNDGSLGALVFGGGRK